ncbi:MAG: YraN family protein [Acidobacteriota bacterium]|nr:YraN family protein [Blastocatellia bacterium]MDW8240242.1 YraN family protein [Acidobacteriota bacterium]
MTQQPAHLTLGQRGERFAVEYLKHREGYRIVAQNFSVPLGRNRRNVVITGEIDIVAYDGETLVFVEVKTRSQETVATAASALDRPKQRTLSRAARAYRRLLHLDDAPYRYDLVTVVFENERCPTITLYKGYFRERPMREPSTIW